jgi:O-antigen/teichoic acid export membrane protein
LSRAGAREFAAFGSRLSGFSRAITGGRAPDNILAGRFLGSSAVGLMTTGNKLIYFPVERLCGAIYNVFLPTTVELGDTEAQSRAFQSAARMLRVIVGPIALGTVAIAPEIVSLLPPQWSHMTPLLIVYALTALILPLNYLSLAVLIAHGRAGLLFRIALSMIPLCWAGATIGALSGSVLAMVGAWSFAIFVCAAAFYWFAARYLKLHRSFWWRQLAPLLVSGAMAAGVRTVLHLAALGGRRSGFVVGVVTGVVLYGAFAWVAMREDVVRIGSLLRRAAGRKPAT